MKKIVNILLALVLNTGVLTCVEAQRGGNRGSERSTGSGFTPQRNFSSQRIITPQRDLITQRSFSPQRSDPGNFSNRDFRSPSAEVRTVRDNGSNNISRSATFRHQDGRSDAMNNSRVISPDQQRNPVATAENRPAPNNYANNQQRGYGSNSYGNGGYSGRGGYNTYNNYNHYNNYNNYNRGGGYYPRFYGYGPRYRVIPSSFISINFGGYPYYYNEGLFYGYSGGYYQSLFPPLGLSIGALPYGYSQFFIGNDPFYYYNGIYYRQYPDQNTYQVVDAPMGATVSSLPKGAKSVVLNGEKLYELNGTYYKEDRNAKGATVYTVVGKNGEVNNSGNAGDNADNVAPPSLNNGDVIQQLPQGSKIVTINGQKLYVTPDNTYLKEQADGNVLQYEVVGK